MVGVKKQDLLVIELRLSLVEVTAWQDERGILFSSFCIRHSSAGKQQRGHSTLLFSIQLWPDGLTSKYNFTEVNSSHSDKCTRSLILLALH